MTKKLKVLITGGAGFIASNIADEFIANGHLVIIVDNLSSGKIANLNPKAKFYEMDICDPKIEDVIKKEKPDIVDHHAAQIDVRKSLADPMFDARTNVLGSLNVFTNAIKYGVKKIIFASTGGALYGEAKYLPADEKHPIEPISPYAISKFATENYLRAMATDAKIEYTVLRYANVYGPRQDPHGEAGVVSIFIGKLQNDETAVLYGFGKPIRDYVFVKDVVLANKLALFGGKNQTYNVGTGKGVSVEQVYNILAKIMGKNIKPKKLALRAGEIHCIYLSSAKIRKDLKWKPGFSLEDGLRETVSYFKQAN